MGFPERRGGSLNVVSSSFNSSDKSGEALPFWRQQAFIDQLLAAGRRSLALLVVWLLWRRVARPQLTRRAEAVKTVQQQTQTREKVEDAVEVRLSESEQLQQRRANQRLRVEVMSQRIHEMSGNDPRVVALVIRQWINSDHE